MLRYLCCLLPFLRLSSGDLGGGVPFCPFEILEIVEYIEIGHSNVMEDVDYLTREKVRIMMDMPQKAMLPSNIGVCYGSSWIVPNGLSIGIGICEKSDVRKSTEIREWNIEEQSTTCSNGKGGAVLTIVRQTQVRLQRILPSSRVNLNDRVLLSNRPNLVPQTPDVSFDYLIVGHCFDSLIVIAFSCHVILKW